MDAGKAPVEKERNTHVSAPGSVGPCFRSQVTGYTPYERKHDLALFFPSTPPFPYLEERVPCPARVFERDCAGTLPSSHFGPQILGAKVRLHRTLLLASSYFFF
jgi:hypothetical protein